MFELTLLEYSALFSLVAFAGFVDSVAGGGGLITIPTYLAFGVPSELILGTNKCVSTSGGSLAIYRYLKNGVINFKVMIYAIVTGLIGSSIGTQLSRHLDSKRMVYLLIVLVPFVLFLNWYKGKSLKKKSNAEIEALSAKQMILRSSLIGLIIGCYDGFFGPGTGTFLIIALVFFMNMNMVEASPNARVVNFTSNITAFVIFLAKGLILWKVAMVAIVASMFGNHIGSGLVIKGNEKVVKIIFNFVLVGLLFKSILDLIQN